MKTKRVLVAGLFVCFCMAAVRADTVISKVIPASGTLSGTIVSDGFAIDVDAAAVIQTGAYDCTLDALGFSFFGGVSRSTSSFTFSASLYAVGGDNLPSGSGLAMQTNLAADLGSTANLAFGSFLYDSSDIAALTNVVLSANTKYAIVLNSDDADKYLWAYDTGDFTFSDGFSYIGSANSIDGGAWSGGSNRQGLVVGVTEVIPEPATALILSLGGGLIGLYRRFFGRV